jgi:hypothetical protein
VTLVEGEERVSEIARMLGGEKISDTTRAHAREMLHLHNKNLSANAITNENTVAISNAKVTAKVKAKA